MIWAFEKVETTDLRIRWINRIVLLQSAEKI